ncbi:hypothetical protein MUK42_35842 [Musa troglodytarum]|uniref:Protein TIC 21, chloroplastic n=1 Tax=Musa troglodytarum TaxID=320322 RepID=A0A9E7EAT7_9LILI|nr:hypothetical protein MUK42_35842 [Musa troglodytarum]
MQALLRPPVRSTAAQLLPLASSSSPPLPPRRTGTLGLTTPLYHRRPDLSSAPSKTLSPSPALAFPGFPSPFPEPKRRILVKAASSFPSSDEESERAKLAQAPPRADVVKTLKNGIVLNLLGMGAAILGMQATVGLLVAKALTTSAVPYYQGISPGQSPVLALDVFLVQASANTILSHFLGLVFSLELLRTVTLPNLEAVPIPKAA